MAEKRTRQNLQNLFAAGKIPMAEDFADIFASSLNQLDDEIRKEKDQALKLKIPATTDPKQVLLLYSDFNADPLWKMQVRDTGLELSRGSAIQPDLVIGANGNVGIGTATPKSKLDIEGGITIGASYAGTNAAPTNGAIIEGNVGIGTSSPSAKLEIIAGASDRPDQNGLCVYNQAVKKHAIVSIRVVADTDRTVNNRTGDPLITWDVKGVRGWCMGIDHSDNYKLKIAPTWNSLGTNTAMTIDTSGNVGIGTNNPDSHLEIWGNEIDTRMKILSKKVDKYTNIALGRTGIDAQFVVAGVANKFFTGVSAGDLCIRQEGSSNKIFLGVGTDSADLVIKNNSVGIGTTEPVAKLQLGNLIINRDNPNNITTQFNGTQLIINQPDSNMNGNTLKSTKSILSLVREGISGVNGNMADFRLGRYEKSSNHSRSQLDIFLTHDSFDSPLVNVMTLRSNGDFLLEGIKPIQFKTYDVSIDQFDIGQRASVFSPGTDPYNNPHIIDTNVSTEEWLASAPSVHRITEALRIDVNAEVEVYQHNQHWHIRIHNQAEKKEGDVKKIFEANISIIFFNKNICNKI